MGKMAHIGGMIVLAAMPLIGQTSVKFKAIDLPIDTQKSQLHASDEVVVNGVTQTIAFTKLLQTGYADNGEMYGQLKDKDDNPLKLENGAPYLCNGTSNPYGSGSGLDHVTILQKKDKLFMVSQFECQVGAYYMNELTQDVNGVLKPKPDTLRFVSEKNEFGGYVHCAGMKTPWESHLGSEEYPADARKRKQDGSIDIYYNYAKTYWGNLDDANPYYYGWIPEIKVDERGNAAYTKHYAMGRFSHELAYVMPDRKTVYMTDDGTNTGFFMFKADRAEDLSAGTLYAAKWMQTNATDGGSAKIEWIRLGHATDQEIRAMLDPDNNTSTNDGLKFEDIFEGVNPQGESCQIGFTSVNTEAGHECLKVKSGMEKAAAYLESRRYAAMQGATTEFRKGEGITYDAQSQTLYVSMSEVTKGMEDANPEYDKGGYNHIRLPKNRCGTVFAFEVDESFTAMQANAEISGKPQKEGCAFNGLANPDNLTFLPGSNVLVIGEDSSYHENNMVWAYDTATKHLDRIVTLPKGAEATSPFWYPNVNGFGYLLLVTQHPNIRSEYNGQSGVGALGPIRGLDRR